MPDFGHVDFSGLWSVVSAMVTALRVPIAILVGLTVGEIAIKGVWSALHPDPLGEGDFDDVMRESKRSRAAMVAAVTAGGYSSFSHDPDDFHAMLAGESSGGGGNGLTFADLGDDYSPRDTDTHPDWLGGAEDDLYFSEDDD